MLILISAFYAYSTDFQGSIIGNGHEYGNTNRAMHLWHHDHLTPRCFVYLSMSTRGGSPNKEQGKKKKKAKKMNA